MIKDNVKTTLEMGTIEALSVQGDLLFAVVRRSGKMTRTEAGEDKEIIGDLFGNMHGVPEQMLSLAEVLIETDVNISLMPRSPKYLIGKQVLVEVDQSGNPLIVRISTNPRQSGSRAIDRKHIYSLRKLSKSGDVDIPEVRKKMLDFGYSPEEVGGVLGEKYIQSGLYGKVGTYGTRSSWTSVESSESSKTHDLSKGISLDLVLGLSGSYLISRKCSNPSKIISGR